MRLKIFYLASIFFTIQSFGQKLALTDLLASMAYPNIKIGINNSDFNKIVSFPYESMSIDYNKTYELNDEFASSFLGFKCYSYYSFNSKGLLSLITWKIYESPNNTEEHVKLANRLFTVIGNSNSDTTYNSPSEIRKIIWVQNNLILRYYYNKNQNLSSISLESSEIKSNIYGQVESIAVFFKKRRFHTNMMLNIKESPCLQVVLLQAEFKMQQKK